MNAFEALVEPHRAPLRLHCCRMLGSSHDSDDMVQETFVRAFRAQHTLADPGAARAWLYRIATHVCIDELAKRPRRARGPELGPPADPDTPTHFMSSSAHAAFFARGLPRTLATAGE
jgi:RNA polymerase sigma-70 factor (ECF subfamily)